MQENGCVSLGGLLWTLLPDAGPYAYAVRRFGNLANRTPAADVDILAAGVLDNAKRGASVCLASFDGAGHKHANVAKARSWVLDADVGEGKYADYASALKALAAFGVDTKLPLTLVSSGTGVHAYASVDEELNGAQHRAVGEALLGLAAARGLLLDTHPTPRAEMPMRAVGTMNHKSGKDAELLLLGRRVSLAHLMALVAPYWTAPQDQGPSRDPVGADCDTSAEALLRACQQARSAADNMGGVERQVRRLLYKTLAWTSGGREAAHRAASQREGYDSRDVDRYVDEGAEQSGPVKCSTWERNVPGGCEGCVHRPADSTPLSAASDLPAGYVRVDGLVHTLGGEDGPECVWHEPLEFVQYGTTADGTYRMVLRRQTVQDGWCDVVVPTAALGGRPLDLVTCLAGQGMVTASKEEGQALDRLARMGFKKLAANRPAEVFVDQMGWRDDGAFVLGGTAYSAAGETRAVFGKSGAATKAKHLKLAGTMNGWLDALRALSQAQARHAEFSLMASLSAPLWKFADFAGSVYCFNHRDSGSGKTLALFLGASVWGDPQPQMVQVSTSELSLAKNLAVLNTIPMFMDEVTEVRSGLLNSLVMQVSQGSDKDRMRQTGELRETLEWRTVLLMTSNSSAASILSRGRHISRAQALRVVDLAVPFDERIGAAGRAAAPAMRRNHGHMGLWWVKHLVALGEGGIYKALADAEVEFEGLYGGILHSSERFWRSALITALAAGRLSQQQTGLDPLPPLAWGMENVLAMRRVASDMEPDAVELLVEFQSDHTENTVWLSRSLADRNGAWLPPHEGYGINKPVYVRIERLYNCDTTVPGAMGKEDAVEGTMYLSYRKLRVWLAEKGIKYEDLKPELDKSGVLLAKYEPHQKGRVDAPVSLAAGTVAVSTAKERVVALRLKGDPRLAGHLRSSRGVVDAG